MRFKAQIKEVRKLADEQASDESLWVGPETTQTEQEAKLRLQLRRLLDLILTSFPPDAP